MVVPPTKMMKRFFPLFLATAGLTLFPLSLPVEAQSDCFIQGSDGQSIDLSGLCGNSSPSVTPATPQNRIQLPIKRRLNGIPTVDITFNNHKTFEMLFDTGASGIMITPDMAEALAIKPERTGYSETAGGVVPIGIGLAKTVAGGGLIVKDVPVVINPSHSMDLGLLGHTFYQGYDVTIKEKVIELRPR